MLYCRKSPCDIVRVNLVAKLTVLRNIKTLEDISSFFYKNLSRDKSIIMTLIS